MKKIIVLSLSLLLFSCAASKLVKVQQDKIPTVSLLPEIVSINPPEGSKDVPTISKIKINFKNTKLAVRTGKGSIFVLTRQGGKGFVPCSVKSYPGTICLVPKERLQASAFYLVTLLNVFYEDGTLMKGATTISFSTMPYAW